MVMLSPAGCCCEECQYCESGTLPTSMQIDVVGVANGDCNNCAAINGSYVLDLQQELPVPNRCAWLLDFEEIDLGSGDDCPGSGVINFQVVLSADGGDIRVDLFVGGNLLTAESFKLFEGVDKINCTNDLDGLVFDSFNDDGICDWSSATVTITVL